MCIDAKYKQTATTTTTTPQAHTRMHRAKSTRYDGNTRRKQHYVRPLQQLRYIETNRRNTMGAEHAEDDNDSSTKHYRNYTTTTAKSLQRTTPTSDVNVFSLYRYTATDVSLSIHNHNDNCSSNNTNNAHEFLWRPFTDPLLYWLMYRYCGKAIDTSQNTDDTIKQQLDVLNVQMYRSVQQPFLNKFRTFCTSDSSFLQVSMQNCANNCTLVIHNYVYW